MLCSDLNEKEILKRGDICIHIVDFLVVQTVNNLPAMQEMLVQSLGWEDPLDKGMANPLQDSCLENPMDGGAWWSTVHRVTESRTRLKRLSTSIGLLKTKLKS